MVGLRTAHRMGIWGAAGVRIRAPHAANACCRRCRRAHVSGVVALVVFAVRAGRRQRWGWLALQVVSALMLLGFGVGLVGNAFGFALVLPGQDALRPVFQASTPVPDTANAYETISSGLFIDSSGRTAWQVATPTLLDPATGTLYWSTPVGPIGTLKQLILP